MADLVDYETQIKEMKQMNDELKLREQDAKLNMEKAAEYGKQLIYELNVVKMAKEKAEQEVYELSTKLEREVHAYKSFEKDYAEKQLMQVDLISLLISIISFSIFTIVFFAST